MIPNRTAQNCRSALRAEIEAQNAHLHCSLGERQIEASHCRWSGGTPRVIAMGVGRVAYETYKSTPFVPQSVPPNLLVDLNLPLVSIAKNIFLEFKQLNCRNYENLSVQ